MKRRKARRKAIMKRRKARRKAIMRGGSEEEAMMKRRLALRKRNLHVFRYHPTKRTSVYWTVYNGIYSSRVLTPPPTPPPGVGWCVVRRINIFKKNHWEQKRNKLLTLPAFHNFCPFYAFLAIFSL